MRNWLDILEVKLRNYLSKLRGLRRPLTNDLFERILYISPDNVRITNYIRRKPLAIFNPGAVVDGDGLLIFPRLVFDYYWYVSSIGLFKLGLSSLGTNEVLSEVINTKVILYPTSKYEVVRGCEDPRVTSINGKYYVFYTAVGPKPLPHYTPEVISDMPLYRASYQGLAILDEGFNLIRKYYLKLGDEVLPNWKDGALVRSSKDYLVMLLRPSLRGIEANWSGLVKLSDFSIDLSSLEPVMVCEDWEYKIGWSTNTVKLGSNEYLVGWHAVLKSDFSYVNGLAVVSDEGELLGTTDYVLTPRGINEVYGDRPHVVFGCGLVLHKEYLIWVGGISDYGICVFRTELSKVLESIRWFKG